MTTVCIKASRCYDIHIERGALAGAGGALAALLPPPRHLALVSDDNVYALYGNHLCQQLKEAGYTVSLFTFPHGEASKNTHTLFALWNMLADSGLTRTDAVVALGGGVVGDLAGFAAATYLRGIPCYQIPTSLLAMVDSSVGGKTAIDLPGGKNLCGAFSQPIGVLCDPDLLSSLPAPRFAEGMAEVIKYGYIGDPALLKLLHQPIDEHLEAVIAKCVAGKRDCVEADEFDTGRRQLLNLGHTAGHAIEKLSDFQISHGEAVAIGMLMAAKAAVSMGLCTDDVPPHMAALLARYRLPTACPFKASDMAAAALSDKKRRGDNITLVLPTHLGESELFDLPVADLAAFFAAGGAL